ncbi:MAG: tetratricopeptide repeat protein [Woeseiaceae bacterium]|nr:tetratricopeptide repeat protein [Woeseiaceae bacterium]MDX2609302.1 tetratricopeptide repeat protein [Woeseiaceae bacterium]
MQGLIRELRRREVFRTVGLYVGICWIAIEAASIFLPAFGAPDWVMRALIIVALIGFPVAVVLSWIYDATDHGVVVQADATDTVVMPLGGRKMDFVAIGLLTVALIFSVYLNFSNAPSTAVDAEPVSLLIADFDNQTGNPLFDGSLEQALALGIEGASFVTAYRRDRALAQVKDLGLGELLNEEAARLIAVRQDVRLVLSGSIKSVGEEFELTLQAIESASGELIVDENIVAGDAAEVLSAINELAANVRRELGEDSLDLDRLESGETVTAASIEAMKFYTVAQDLARAGQDEEAIEYYAKAIEEDSEMARAYSGWGLSAHKIGRSDEATEQWQTALSLLDRMTERERYRTLGLYYTAVSLDYDMAIENYEQLVEKFPADGAGNNNLAILYTFTAQYQRAFAQSEKLLGIYPGRTLYKGNHAQYALYAGDIETALATAEQVIEDDPSFFKSYMILAITALYEKDTEGAKSFYGRMAETGVRGESLSNIGLADIALFDGRFDDAMAILAEGIAQDEEHGNTRGAGTKSIALAQAYVGKGDVAQALDILAGLDAAKGDGQLVPLAEIYAANGQYEKAFEIAEQYRQQLRPTARAYSNLIDGINAYYQDEFVMAIESLRAAQAYADLWIVRFYLGQAYVAGGHVAAAMTEFNTCIERRSEAAGMFFDDVPTWRYTASLGEWKKKADDVLDELRTASVVN